MTGTNSGNAVIVVLLSLCNRHMPSRYQPFVGNMSKGRISKRRYLFGRQVFQKTNIS